MNRKDLFSLVVQRGWLSIAGFGTILILPGTVSAVEQGLFFSFLSIAALQSVFDAGITSVFMNFCAHERVRFNGTDAERIEAQRRLIVIATAARRWFLIVAVSFSVLVGVGGFYYLRSSLASPGEFGRWQSAYALLIVAVGTSLANLGRVALLEGWGHMGDVARIRFRANLGSAAVLWLGLLAGLGVWALSLSYVAQTTAVVFGTARLAKTLPVGSPVDGEMPSTASQINWKQDILPLQVRLGISYFCGYLVSQAVVPFALKFYGAAEAGRIGLANAIFSAATTVLASLIYLSGPKYAETIVRRDWKKMEQMFQKTTMVSIAVGVASYAGLVVVLVGLARYWSFFSGRLPELSVLVALGIIGVANLYVGSAATLMRAFKQEPMLPISVVAATIYIAVMYLARRSDPQMLFTFLTVGQVAIIVPLTMFAKQRFLMRNARS